MSRVMNFAKSANAMAPLVRLDVAAISYFFGRLLLFTNVRGRLRAVSSGNSLYSRGRMTWASTLTRSDFNVCPEVFTVIGFRRIMRSVYRGYRSLCVLG